MAARDAAPRRGCAWARILVAPVMIVSTACASGGGRSTEDCTSDLLRDGRSLAEVVDSAALRRDLETQWTASAGLTLATFGYDSTGAFDSTRVVARSPSPGATARWAETVSRHAAAAGEPEELVHIVIGDEAGLALRRVRELRACAPAVANADALRRELIRQVPRPFPSGSLTTQVRLHVDEEGRVTDVEVEESSSSAAVDSAAVRMWRVGSFRPAMLEGIPFSAWVTLPVTVQGDLGLRLIGCGNYRRPAQRSGLQARRVRLLVGADGVVGSVQPVGAMDSYSARALDIARTCVFEPANGDTRSYPIRQELTFYFVQ